ncbi:MAG: hypothetical protein QXZ70_08070 [Candidatus Bathyarchaeia archaeon]
MRQKEWTSDDLIKNVLSIAGIAAVSLFLILLFKLKGGVTGIALGTVAVAALIYWLMEIRKIFEKQNTVSEEHEWFYDLIEEEESITFTAKVPGPAKKVKVKVVGDTLEIKGGRNFFKKVQIPKGVRLQDKTYTNGILHLKLQKTATLNNKMY